LNSDKKQPREKAELKDIRETRKKVWGGGVNRGEHPGRVGSTQGSSRGTGSRRSARKVRTDW